MRRSACGCMVKWMNLQNGSRATSSCGYFCRIFSPLAVAVRYAAQFSEFTNTLLTLRVDLNPSKKKFRRS